MGKGQPFTPERILKEAREAKLVSHIPLPTTSPRLKEMLENPEFRSTLMEIVEEKLDDIEQGRTTHGGGNNAKQQALKSWNTLLNAIKEAEQQTGHQF